MKPEPMKPYIRIAPGVEYSTDFDFFLTFQIVMLTTRSGTVFTSLLEHRQFLHTKRRFLSERMVRLICRSIHREICALRYGGELVE